jgi:hypothetical protein
MRVVRECHMIDRGRVRARLDDTAMAHGPKLLADLRALRQTAARAFEQHVLKKVAEVPRCTVELQKIVEGSQIDAMATCGRAEVIVEVRARVGPGGTAAVRGAREWLQSLPLHLPVLLIVPAEPTPSLDWQAVIQRPGLTVLFWDEHSDQLTDVLTSMLNSINDLLPASPEKAIAAA